jgi:hypothetical protein
VPITPVSPALGAVLANRPRNNSASGSYATLVVETRNSTYVFCINGCSTTVHATSGGEILPAPTCNAQLGAHGMDLIRSAMEHLPCDGCGFVHDECDIDVLVGRSFSFSADGEKITTSTVRRATLTPGYKTLQRRAMA